MNDHDGWTLGHGLGLQLVRSGERVFFGHGGAMPGFLAMLLGRRRRESAPRSLTNASTPGAAVEEVRLELAEKALELYAAEPEPWRPEAEPPPEIAELLGTWWDGGDAVRLLVGGRPAARPPGGERHAAARLRLRGRRRRPVPRRRGPRARRAPPRRPRRRTGRSRSCTGRPTRSPGSPATFVLASAGLVEDQRRADVGDDAAPRRASCSTGPGASSAAARIAAPPMTAISTCAERERERVDRQERSATAGIRKTATWALEESAISVASLTWPRCETIDRAAVLRGVADDGDDHRCDEEVAQVQLLGEDLDRADEDLGDERGRDRREPRG